MHKVQETIFNHVKTSLLAESLRRFFFELVVSWMMSDLHSKVV